MTATLAHHLDPDSPGRMTPARALRAVGLYLDRERPVATEPPQAPPLSISLDELRRRMGMGGGRPPEVKPAPPADPDPTTIDVSGTGPPGIVATEDGKDSDYGAWWWGDSMRYAAGFLDTGWAAYTPADVDIIASGPETGPEARRLAYAALERYVASKRGDDAQ